MPWDEGSNEHPQMLPGTSDLMLLPRMLWDPKESRFPVQCFSLLAFLGLAEQPCHLEKGVWFAESAVQACSSCTAEL
jgi:hypothetical protein